MGAEVSTDRAAGTATDAHVATLTCSQYGDSDVWSNAGGDAPSSTFCEPALLSQLVQLLATRHGHSLLLSDLGALLPGPLRHGVKEKGGLRSWLQKYPQLFLVSGQPGKESVMCLAFKEGSVDSREDHMQSLVDQKVKIAREHELLTLKKKDDDEDNESAVQLRGLPYRATVSDVKLFLGEHLANVKDEGSVQLVLNRDGRPSGFARVQFKSPEMAKAARDDRHMRVMQVGGTGAQTEAQGASDRYVEMFLYSERPNKLRFKKLSGEGQENPDNEEDMEALGITKETIVNECRVHMKCPGKGQLLLSMLGVALSPAARLFLKKSDQGLKHFLAQYPLEFSVDGAKGRECITYLPAMGAGEEANSDLPASFKDFEKAMASATAPAQPKRLEETCRTPKLEPTSSYVPESPKPRMSTSDNPYRDALGPGMATPSDWGTPQNFALRWDPRSDGKPSMPGIESLGLWGNGGMPGSDPLSNFAKQESAAADMKQVQHLAAAAALGASAMGSANHWGGLPGVPPPLNFWGANPSLMPPWAHLPPNGVNWEAAGHMAAHARVPPSDAVAQAQAFFANYGFGHTMSELSMQSVNPLLGASSAEPPQTAEAEKSKSTSLCAHSSSNPPVAVRMRGLPFTATEQDVLAFFAKHEVVEFISEDPKAVRLLTKSNGKPLGHAVVQLNSYAEAELALEALNGKYMGNRYIEVFHHTDDERPSKEGAKESLSRVEQSPEATLISDTGGSATPLNYFNFVQGAEANWWPPVPPSMTFGKTPMPVYSGMPGVEALLALSQSQDASKSASSRPQAPWDALFEELQPEVQQGKGGRK